MFEANLSLTLMSLQLSQDIIDYIVDTLFHSIPTDDAVEETYLWHQQWELLNTCSLINRAFLPRSHAHMFRKLDFTVRNTGHRKGLHQRCKSFYKILKDNPAIADYVQQVKICLYSNLDTSWIAWDNAFVGIMRVLARSKSPLQQFTFMRFPHCHFLPEAQPFVKHVADLFIIPTITSLYLKDISNLPIDILERCKSLRELTLEGVDFASRIFLTTEHINLPTLRKLDYHRSRTAILKVFGLDQCQSAVLNISNLQNLTISINHLEDLQCAQMVLSASQSLEKLSLNRFPDEGVFLPSLIGHINLNACNHLQSLELPAIFQKTYSAEEPLAYIFNILRTIPATNCINKVKISVFVNFSRKVAAEGSLDADWETFALEIRRISARKPLLLSVHVLYTDVERSRHRYGRLEEIETVYASVLKRLMRRRMNIIRNDSNITITTSQMVRQPWRVY